MLLKSSTFAHLMNLFELTNYISLQENVLYEYLQDYILTVLLFFFLS